MTTKPVEFLIKQGGTVEAKGRITTIIRIEGKLVVIFIFCQTPSKHAIPIAHQR